MKELSVKTRLQRIATANRNAGDTELELELKLMHIHMTQKRMLRV